MLDTWEGGWDSGRNPNMKKTDCYSGQKAGAIVSTLVEQSNLQRFGAICFARRLEPLLQCGQKTLLFIVFRSKRFGQKAWTIDCYNMGRKHCKLQYFATSCLARRLEPLLRHREKTL